MTLAFIGEYDDPAKIKAIISKVPLPEFRLALSDTGNFGNILWAGVKGNQKLKAYAKDLRRALETEGIPYDKAKFVPHITLIRKYTAKKGISGAYAEGRNDREEGSAYEIRAEKRKSCL